MPSAATPQQQRHCLPRPTLGTELSPDSWRGCAPGPTPPSPSPSGDPAVGALLSGRALQPSQPERPHQEGGGQQGDLEPEQGRLQDSSEWAGPWGWRCPKASSAYRLPPSAALHREASLPGGCGRADGSAGSGLAGKRVPGEQAVGCISSSCHRWSVAPSHAEPPPSAHTSLKGDSPPTFLLFSSRFRRQIHRLAGLEPRDPCCCQTTEFLSSLAEMGALFPHGVPVKLNSAARCRRCLHGVLRQQGASALTPILSSSPTQLLPRARPATNS